MARSSCRSWARFVSQNHGHRLRETNRVAERLVVTAAPLLSSPSWCAAPGSSCVCCINMTPGSTRSRGARPSVTARPGCASTFASAYDVCSTGGVARGAVASAPLVPGSSTGSHSIIPCPRAGAASWSSSPLRPHEGSRRSRTPDRCHRDDSALDVFDLPSVSRFPRYPAGPRRVRYHLVCGSWRRTAGSTRAGPGSPGSSSDGVAPIERTPPSPRGQVRRGNSRR